MRKWVSLLLGLVLGALAGKAMTVEPAHACEPACPPDESVVLEVTDVDGGQEARQFWVGSNVRDAVVTPHYLLFAVGEGQVELGYSK